jgi:hypothetical protein
MYGDRATVEQWTVGHADSVEVCHSPKTIVTEGRSFAATQTVLDQALHQYGRELAPLAECGQ